MKPISPVPPPKATRREWIGLAIIALPCLLYSMDLTVLNLAIPSIIADLHPTSTQLLWIVDIYGFFVAGSLITMGNLGDRFGRRKLLMIGAVVFGLASIFAAFANTPNMLILARACLGIAGATLAPSTLSLIRNMFHDEIERTRAISIWIVSFSLGGAIGPLVGGILLEKFWWGSVFLVSLPVMVLLLFTAPKLLPEYRDENAGRVDHWSALLSLISILSIIYGLKQSAAYGISLSATLIVLFGLMVATIFVRRQKNLTYPLMDLRLFQNPHFNVALVIYTLSGFILFGLFVHLAQYLQLVLHLTPLIAGLWTLPWMLGFVFGSMAAPNLVQRFTPIKLMTTGLVIGAVGFAILTQLGGTHDLAIIVIGSSIFSLAMAPIFTVATEMIIGSAPPERAGSAAAMSETCGELGGALGIAILGSLGIMLYRYLIADAFPEGMSAEVVAHAKLSFNDAVNAMQPLAEPIKSQAIAKAGEAFTRALQCIAAIAALCSLVMAAMTLKFLKPQK
jgi:DHA2 family multidrug resistance protein-like MFS transporter